MVTIELTNKDAELFVQFRKHQNFFMVLIESEIHELKSSSATLHFDADGTLGKIITEKVAYKR